MICLLCDFSLRLLVDKLSAWTVVLFLIEHTVTISIGEGNIYVCTNVLKPGWKTNNSVSYSQHSSITSASSCLAWRRFISCEFPKVIPYKARRQKDHTEPRLDWCDFSTSLSNECAWR